MAEITKPIALDESFNTTEGSPRNLADVLAQGIGDLVTVVSRISHQTVYDELDKLNDVNISAPTNGDVLTYDGSKWTNGQVGGGSAEQMIAPVEISTTASQAYAIGEQFILNGVLYTATAAITAGGTITINGNCTASDTVTEQIANAGIGLKNITEYKINIAGNVPTATEMANAVQTINLYGSVIITFFNAGNWCASTFYGNLVGDQYGAGILVSYYSSKFFKVTIAGGTATLTAF